METYSTNLGRNDSSIRYNASKDNVQFWDEQARLLHWFTPWEETLQWSPPFARWFVGGTTNISYNALDIHQDDIASKPAILWEGEDNTSQAVSYDTLYRQVQRAANLLKSLGVKKGDRITIYLPMIPEIIVSMMACARIGAVHTVVFSGFSAKSLTDRMNDSGSTILITADVGYRRGKKIPLAQTAQEALRSSPKIQHVIVVQREDTIPSSWIPWTEIHNKSDNCVAEPVKSTDPLFILYTSGTTGKPKGVLHGTGGYMTHIHSTFRWAFDIQNTDIYHCTADVGWVTGHSYVAYAPFLCGATQVMYEGAPDYPSPSRTWQILEKYNVSIFYTTPTALRMLMRHDSMAAKSHDLSSLRLLGSVGEPINPEVWRWYHDTIGAGRCPVIDTWWQTETGGMLISALPGIESIPLKPGSGTLPIPGIDMSILDENGAVVPPDTKGYLVVRNLWPGMMLTLWGDEQKYRDTYWSRFPNCYYPGDYAIQDKDGYMWLLGRADDILKVSGHRIGTAELESCLISHERVAESAVIGIPDEIRGEGIVAFVVLRSGMDSAGMESELKKMVSDLIGAVARPDAIHIVPILPKTRSGKIMRRLLKGLITGEQIGDTTTMEEPGALDEVRRVLRVTTNNTK
ncbi:MAG: acetate--CoA ligase [Cenarchaeum sp. SB0669_bin_11]|nr:acetate--CoA ligase [Cenarchaeum sp. SB0669_bin_11]